MPQSNLPGYAGSVLDPALTSPLNLPAPPNLPFLLPGGVNGSASNNQTTGDINSNVSFISFLNKFKFEIIGVGVAVIIIELLSSPNKKKKH
ncbi:MAG: hypothetical protein ACRDE2_00240 [Chitinophagaceae bacterium]